MCRCCSTAHPVQPPPPQPQQECDCCAGNAPCSSNPNARASAALPPCRPATPSWVFGNRLHCLTCWPASAPPHSQCWSCCTSQWREQPAGLVSRMHTVACTPLGAAGGGGPGTIPVSEAQMGCCLCAGGHEWPRVGSHSLATCQPNNKLAVGGAPADVREDADVWVLP